MDYAQIKDFLDKFKQTLFKKEEVYVVIIDTVFKYTSFLLKPKQIKIKNSFIYIDSTPMLKSEILVFKNKILLDLKKEIPNSLFIDIK